MKLLLLGLHVFFLIQSGNIMAQLVSAQVVLKPAKQNSPRSSKAITAATIAEHLPAQESITLATKEMAKLGFEVGSVGGNNFSITAPQQTFEKVFNVKLSPDKKGVKLKLSTGTSTDLLPVRALPQSVANCIQEIVLPEAPEFGPGSY